MWLIGRSCSTPRPSVRSRDRADLHGNTLQVIPFKIPISACFRSIPEVNPANIRTSEHQTDISRDSTQMRRRCQLREWMTSRVLPVLDWRVFQRAGRQQSQRYLRTSSGEPRTADIVAGEHEGGGRRFEEGDFRARSQCDLDFHQLFQAHGYQLVERNQLSNGWPAHEYGEGQGSENAAHETFHTYNILNIDPLATFARAWISSFESFGMHGRDAICPGDARGRRRILLLLHPRPILSPDTVFVSWLEA